MKAKKPSSPTTIAYNRDDFADALRGGILCLPLKTLKLSGPEGEFEAEGILVSRDDKLMLEYSPVPPDRSTVPEASKKGFSIEYSAADWWTAEGITSQGVELRIPQLVPPFEEWQYTNGHYRYEQNIQRLEIGRCLWGSLPSTLPANDGGVVGASLRAWIPNAELKIKNASVRTEVHHPFFRFPTSSTNSCFMSELSEWRYCFTQKGPDILVHLNLKDGYSSPSRVHDRRVLNGVLRAFSFIHGMNVQPWRTVHLRSDEPIPNEFFVDFHTETGAPQPIGGPQEHCLEGDSSIAIKMMNLLAVYFASDTPMSELMIKHHWQFVQACSGDDVRLYECLHLCAVLEGIVKSILRHRLGWSKTKDKNSTALQKFEAATGALGLVWDGQFDLVYTIWKDARDSLAHGDFFGPEASWEKDVFKIHSFVSGGIMALILADAGWSEPIDFSILNHTSSLYY